MPRRVNYVLTHACVTLIPRIVNYVLRLVVVLLSLSGTWSGKPHSILLGKMEKKVVEKVMVKKVVVEKMRIQRKRPLSSFSP